MLARSSFALSLVFGCFIALPARAQELSEAEKAAGFVSLFDGKTLDGWQGGLKGYGVENGAIVCLPTGGGNLYTNKQYGDFVLRFEFKFPKGANNGIGIRAPLTGDSAFQGMEIQVLDEDDERYKGIQPWQVHGSVYGVVAAKRGHLKPVGEWNSEEIRAVGRRITVVLNGVTIVDADLDEATKNGTLDGKEHPGVKNSAGHIGFLGHGARVEFRNLRVQDLAKK